MPITSHELETLKTVLTRMEDSQRRNERGIPIGLLEAGNLARLTYETLLEARHNGLGFAAMSVLGKHILDEAGGSWENIKELERVTEMSLRIPLIRSMDTHWKSLFSGCFIGLSDDEAICIGGIMRSSVDAKELIGLTRLLYDTIRKLKLNKEGKIAFGKLLYAKVGWQDAEMPAQLKSTLAVTCIDFMCKTLPDLFIVIDGAEAAPQAPISTVVGENIIDTTATPVEPMKLEEAPETKVESSTVPEDMSEKGNGASETKSKKVRREHKEGREEA